MGANRIGMHSPSKNSRSSPLASKEEAQAMTSPFIEKLARAAFKADYAWRKANNAAFPKQDELSLPDDDAGLDTAFRLFVGLDETAKSSKALLVWPVASYTRFDWAPGVSAGRRQTS